MRAFEFGTMFSKPDIRQLLPIVFMSLLGAVLFFWNNFVGMSWQGAGTGYLLLISSPLLVLALYSRARHAPVLAETCLFLFLYSIYPALGVKLGYLATELGFPLIDHTLAGLDSDLGFSWNGWSEFFDRHHVMRMFVATAYLSPGLQAIGTTLALSVCSPGRRNYETLFILVASLSAVIVIYAIFPALGPVDRSGDHNMFGKLMLQVRAGDIHDLPYLGVVQFPSYHAIMAIVFTYAHRGLRYSFPVVFTLNAVMLPGLPNIGGHYLVDMIAGGGVAYCTILAARKIYSWNDRADGSPHVSVSTEHHRHRAAYGEPIGPTVATG